jgi:hypothetical protein
MVGQFPELSVALPIVTTWKQALRAIEEALGDIDQEVLIFFKKVQGVSGDRTQNRCW